MPKTPEVDRVDHHHLSVVQVERIHEMRDVAPGGFVDELVDRHSVALRLVRVGGGRRGVAFG